MKPGRAAPEGAAVAALDFGGTKLVFGIVDRKGAILWRSETPTAGRQPPEVVAWALREWKGAAARPGIVPEVGAIGATVPGLVDAGKRTLVHAPTHGWRDVPFAALLSEAFSLPATIDNDVNACALAEQRFGVAGGVAHVLWVTVSTGIGGALLLNGDLYDGRGAAGEIGHFIVEEGGPLCGCGHRGCLQAVASGRALAEKARAQGLGDIDARTLFDLAGADHVARTIIRDATEAVARALAFAVNLIDPEQIVIGGGVGLRLDFGILRDAMTGRILLPEERAPAVVPTKMEANAGLLGAAAIAFRRLLG